VMVKFDAPGPTGAADLTVGDRTYPQRAVDTSHVSGEGKQSLNIAERN